MSDIPIIIVRTGAITAASKRKIEKAGVVVIESDDPSSIRYITAQQELSGGDMLIAAMRALRRVDNMYANSTLLKELLAALEAKREPAPTNERG